MTFSMCSETSASRSSMCLGSVQMRLVTRASLKSARCMKAAKFSPSPTGSMIKNRSLLGGIVTSSRNIRACIASIAAARPLPRARNRTDGRSGNGTVAGSRYSPIVSRASWLLVGTPSGI